MDELELLEDVKYALRESADASYRDVEFTNPPSDNAATVVTLLDGTKFLVSVTKLEEGE